MNTVLRSFQFEILHGSLVTNSYLYRCKLIDTSECNLCKSQTETIEHLFVECPNVMNLWKAIGKTLETGLNLKDHLSKEEVVLGVKVIKNTDLMNHVLIAIKRYIYICRCLNKNLSIGGAITFIKGQYNSEIQLSKQARYRSLENKWEPIKHILSM